jgi:hypothetical protein
MSKVNELIQQYTSDALEIRRHIHRHPELSMEEKNTTEFISQQLLKYGIEISDIPFKSGVLGILKGGEIPFFSVPTLMHFRWSKNQDFPLLQKIPESATVADMTSIRPPYCWLHGF